MSTRVGDVIITIIDCNGTPLAVVTEQKPGESEEDFLARHDAEVDAARKRCEDGGGGDSSATTWVNAKGETMVFVPRAGRPTDEEQAIIDRAKRHFG
ncbi:MAG: hypothetical protein AAGB93_00485 [Planctomycetota bacterium]